MSLVGNFSKKLKLSFFFFLFCQNLWCVLPEEIKAEVAKVGEILARECPPPECLIVGIGRSPTPFIDYLEITRPGTTRALPLSSFKFYPRSSFPLALNEEEKLKLFSHFEEFLNPLGPEIKRIYVVDFSSSGHSALSATHYLKEYIKKINRPSLEVSPYMLLHPYRSQMFFQGLYDWGLTYEQTPKYLTLNEKLGSLLWDQYFDDLAPYGKFDIRVDSEVSGAPNSRKRKAYLNDLRSSFCRIIKEIP